MTWSDRSGERTSRKGSFTAVSLIVAAVAAVVVGMFLLRDIWPG
jgi:hypothetical protein